MSAVLTREVRKAAMRTAGREMAEHYGQPLPVIGLAVLASSAFRRTFSLWCVAIVLAPHPTTYPKN